MLSQHRLAAGIVCHPLELPKGATFALRKSTGQIKWPADKGGSRGAWPLYHVNRDCTDMGNQVLTCPPDANQRDRQPDT